MKARLSELLVSDLVMLSHEMRPDEKDQWCAVVGVEQYDPNLAAKIFTGFTGPSYCLVDEDGRPLAAAGFEQVRDKVWQPWMAGTMDAWRDHWRAITKLCKREGDRILSEGANRLQIYSLPERPAAHRWYETLGYRYESTCSMFFADGRDAICHVKTRNH